jgi:hypothetical protein
LGNLGIEAAVAPPCSSRDAFAPGQAVRARGDGFAPGASVSVRLSTSSWEGEIGSVTANGTGLLDAVVTIASTAPAPAVGVIRALGPGADGDPRLLLVTIGLQPDFVADGDQDGTPDACDTCPGTASSDQGDDDGDGTGNPCDACPNDAEDDWDQDGLCADADACPLDPANDADGDGVCAPDDNCPSVANPEQADADANGVGDACPAAPACADGIDNDQDGAIDHPDDPGCQDGTDLTERSPSLPCDDGADNDADALSDHRPDGYGDPGCRGALSPRENPECDDDLDNDGKGDIDWDGGMTGGTPDPQCLGRAWRNIERSASCGLGYELVLLFSVLPALRSRLRRGCSMQPSPPRGA